MPPAGKVGSFVPERVGEVGSASPDREIVEALLAIAGLSASFADALDALGLRVVVPSTAVPPLGEVRSVIGRAVTIRYLPARYEVTKREPLGRLAHRTAFETAAAGDVLVISAPRAIDGSVMGGEALAAAHRAGIAAVVVDGSVRDIDELLAVDVPVWASRRTPSTGRGRIDAVEINGPVDIAGVQVLPGDIVVADASGIAFVPADVFKDIGDQILGRTPA